MVIHINFISMCVHFEMSYTDWCISVSRCLGVNEAAETAAWWTRVGCWCWYWRQWLLHGPSQSYFYLVHNYHCLWGTVVTSHFAVTNEGKVTNKGCIFRQFLKTVGETDDVIVRVVFVGGKPGNFPVTGSDLPSHWFVWKLRGNGNREGRERGKGRVPYSPPHWLLPHISPWQSCYGNVRCEQHQPEKSSHHSHLVIVHILCRPNNVW